MGSPPVLHEGHYERAPEKVAPSHRNFPAHSPVSICALHDPPDSLEDRMRFVPTRSRTRWLLVCGTTAACIAAVATGTFAANASEQRAAAARPSSAATPAPPAEASPAPPAEASPAPPAEASSAPPGGGPAAPEPERAAPLGDVIASGIDLRSGEVVFYGVEIADKALPKTSFGIMAGVRRGQGAPTSRVMANEFDGSDRAPGFHAVSGAMNVEGDDIPTFGYYAGPATKITAGGVTARQAVWSEDPRVVVFWFDPADVPEDFTASNLAAFDRAGRKLPTGHSEVGVG
jgi:hypothetical protein